MRGCFITLEGCEGVGKSTQINLLKQYLEQKNIKALFLREPGGTALGEKLREIILDVNNKEMSDECEAMLYATARIQLVKQVLLPHLNNGEIVFCDRYYDSSIAYQGFARGLGEDFIKKINSYAIENCPPDKTIFFNLDPETAFLRKGGADSGDRIEQQGIAFHKKVYEGYLELLKQEPDRIISVVPDGSKEDTHKKVVSIVDEILKQR